MYFNAITIYIPNFSNFRMLETGKGSGLYTRSHYRNHGTFIFANTLYDRRRRGPARKPVLRLCSSRRLVTFKAAKHAAMQLPCNIVLPPWKRPTSLLSRVFHGLQTLSSSYLETLSPRTDSSLVFQLWNTYEANIYIFIYVKGVNIDSRSSTFSSNADWNCSIKWNSRNQFGKMTISTRSAGNARFRHNSDAPRKLQREHGASVCCAKIPSMGWILNSQRPRENRRSLDDCHVRHGSLVVLIDHLFPP